MTSLDDAVRSLRLRRWMMLAGMVAGSTLAALNARSLFSAGRADWLDVGIVFIWGFVALSGAAGYIMLGRQIARLERQRGPLAPGPPPGA